MYRYGKTPNIYWREGERRRDGGRKRKKRKQSKQARKKKRKYTYAFIYTYIPSSNVCLNAELQSITDKPMG